ncbi:MAG: tRNA pseudouridine(55) synthase TruB [Acidobacteriota bacterium]
MSHEPPCGVLVADKPSGPTSHDIVARVRRFLKTKVGHTGTLDPMATGVLPLVLGRATRLAPFFQANDKEYEAELRLGVSTDTFDQEGRILEEQSVPEISAQQVQDVLNHFTGEIQQQPPMFSAVKVDGKKLYNLARQNRTVDRPFRTISIFSLEILERRPATWRLRVHCSSGTYIRTLAHEIGQKLGCGACLFALRRLRSGIFDLTQALPIEDLEDRWNEMLYPMELLLPELHRVELDEGEAWRIGHGNEVSYSESKPRNLYRLFHREKLMAIGEGSSAAQIRPKIVLRQVE